MTMISKYMEKPTGCDRFFAVTSPALLSVLISTWYKRMRLNELMRSAEASVLENLGE